MGQLRGNEDLDIQSLGDSPGHLSDSEWTSGSPCLSLGARDSHLEVNDGWMRRKAMYPDEIVGETEKGRECRPGPWASRCPRWDRTGGASSMCG